MEILKQKKEDVFSGVIQASNTSTEVQVNMILNVEDFINQSENNPTQGILIELMEDSAYGLNTY